MNFMKPVAILVPGVFAPTMANRLMLVSPLRQALMDVVLIGMDGATGRDGREDERCKGLLLNIFQHRDPNFSAALYHAGDRRLLRGQSPASAGALEPIAPGLAPPDTLRSALMPGNHIHLVTLHPAFQAHDRAPSDDATTQQARR